MHQTIEAAEFRGLSFFPKGVSGGREQKDKLIILDADSAEKKY